jgi:hypothetical protein
VMPVVMTAPSMAAEVEDPVSGRGAPIPLRAELDRQLSLQHA